MDFYAPQTLLSPDGRTVMIAWMQMWSRTTPTAQHGWVGSMILPRELTLKDGKLYQAPVREIERYRWGEVKADRVPLSGEVALPDVKGTCVELCFTLELGTAERAGIKVFSDGTHDARIYYDRASDKVVFDRSRMGIDITCDVKERDASVRSVRVNHEDGRISMRIFLDVSSCEVFLNGGERTMTGNVYSEGSGIVFFAEGGEAVLLDLKNTTSSYDIKDGKGQHSFPLFLSFP